MAWRRGLACGWALAAFGVAVGAGVYLSAGGVDIYRGLSGVSCALLAAVLVEMALADRGPRRPLALGILALMVGRFVFEALAGRSVLPTSLPEGVCVVGAAHLAGLAAGAAFAAGRRLLRWRRRGVAAVIGHAGL